MTTGEEIVLPRGLPCRTVAQFGSEFYIGSESSSLLRQEDKPSQGNVSRVQPRSMDGQWRESESDCLNHLMDSPKRVLIESLSDNGRVGVWRGGVGGESGYGPPLD